MNKDILLLLLASMTCGIAPAQEPEQTSFEIPRSTEISIPASPAFQMLDASSSLVSQPGAIRDFKVDWSFKTYRLTPNLSIEAQPIWSIFYNRPTPDKYQNAGWLLQTLSTLNLSAGSLDFNDSIRLFSYAGKLTLYRGYDALAYKQPYQDLIDGYNSSLALIDSDYASLKRQLKSATSREEKDSLEALVYSKMDEKENLKNNNKQQIQERMNDLKARYWNATTIDVAAGKSFSFNHFTSERIDSIKLDPRSNVCWTNAAIGLGRKWLITGQVRCELLNVTLPDSGNVVLIDSIDTDFDFVNDDTLHRDSLSINFSKASEWIFSYGLNIRYGSPRYNFFIEGFYTKSRVPTFEEVSWTLENGERKKKTSKIKEEFILAFGGEWKISNSVVLSYGIRTTINEKDNKLQMREVVPLASISCLMR